MGANYRQGETLMADYTPVADLEGGSIVAINGLLAVIHSDSPAGVLNAASFPNGNAVYEVTKTTTSDVFAVDDIVDGTAGVTAAASTADLATAGDDRLGICVKASGATDSTVWVALSSGI